MEHKLKNLRIDHDMKQKDVAIILNVLQEQYSRWERGYSSMPIDMYIKLAKHYNISIDYLSGASPIRKTFYQNNINKYKNSKTYKLILIDPSNIEDYVDIKNENIQLIKLLINLLKKTEEN